MQYYRILTSSGQVFYCGEDAKIPVKRFDDITLVEPIEMTDEEYNDLSTDSDAHAFFK